ncbi:MAG TPA: hypothetical protein VFD75_11135 [Pyrinomonadaceae bacterium]|nr:hypothetical protein [Pyrinomonadaceae bacterium]
MNYEVFELLEVGNAGATILEKGNVDFDEIMEPQGVHPEALDD